MAADPDDKTTRSMRLEKITPDRLRAEACDLEMQAAAMSERAARLRRIADEREAANA